MEKFIRQLSSMVGVAILMMPMIALVLSPTANALTGDGSQGNPFQIIDCDELQEMANDLDAYYVLGNNIDCTATATWNANAGFEPIGSIATPFMGSFDGAGFSITGLTMNTPLVDNVGLFGVAGSGEVEVLISNLELIDVNINGNENVGGLAGNFINGTITNTFVSGSVHSVEGMQGGLVGEMGEGFDNNATIEESGSSAEVTSDTGGSNVGGLVGFLGIASNITTSYATGNVTAGDGFFDRVSAGGLVGGAYYDSVITYSYATGNVEATGDNVGGLVGELSTNAHIEKSYATGSVTGRDSVGGLAGFLANSFDEYHTFIKESYSEGPVEGRNYVGGLAGTNRGEVYDSFSHSAVSTVAQENGYIGGFVGYNIGSIYASFSTGDVTLNDGSNNYVDNIGGFVGMNGETSVYSSFATGSVVDNNAGSTSALGGFIGFNQNSQAYPNSGWVVNNDLPAIGIAAGACGENSCPVQEVEYNEVSEVAFMFEPTSGVYTEGQPVNEISTVWDFENTWNFDAQNNYNLPCLQWMEGCSLDDQEENNDEDGVSDEIEQAAPNNGDANGDNTPDSEQSNVTSLVNVVSGEYVSLQTECGLTTPANSSVASQAESSEYKDPAYQYTAGLLSFTLTGCDSTATITQFFYGDFDLDTITPRKYNSVTKAYATIPGATMTKEVIGGEKALKIVFAIADNGPLDEDATVGTIKDPSGPALLTVGVPNTGLYK